MAYKPLRDYGLIGDLRTAALVARDGSIDWCCFPRFDSPSVFAALLDDRRGGCWSVAPVHSQTSTQRYEDLTNILVTTFGCGSSGILQLLDFMPLTGEETGFPNPHEIHRRVEAVGGDVEVEIRFQPRFDYARSSTRFRSRRHGILATNGKDETLTLSSSERVSWKMDDEQGEARARLTVGRGTRVWLVLRYDDDEVWPADDYHSEQKLTHTRKFWLDWCADIGYDGPYRPMVERSALVLKLLVYAPTGAIIASPTTSLPEVVGGTRNWDYRYSWLRDATFMLFGLYALGKFRELDLYTNFLKKICRKESEHLQIMYGVGGELRLPEEELSHLEGYRGSAPVRIGNAAVDQIQLDVYGEVLDAMHIWRRKHPMTEGMWELCRGLADLVVENWRRPDHGAWEVRDRPRHYVFSKMMCWVALDRAIRAAEDLRLGGPVDRWRATREEIREEILSRGWSEERGAFTQHYETDRMDAANLTIPMVRFLPPDDPRVIGTIEQIQAELTHPGSGLLYRYRTPDGLPGQEGTFCVNTFQLAQAYAMCGHHERSVQVFESVLRYASPLGLFSEEIDPDTGELLGNYPQGFSHIGLINAAHVIARTRPRTMATFALLPE
ncbi:MAG: glycoside hydrolase family 15 protein [Gemmatimonadota bacterium]